MPSKATRQALKTERFAECNLRNENKPYSDQSAGDQARSVGIAEKDSGDYERFVFDLQPLNTNNVHLFVVVLIA